jgi:protein required for attachment to host cells
MGNAGCRCGELSEIVIDAQARARLPSNRIDGFGVERAGRRIGRRRDRRRKVEELMTKTKISHGDWVVVCDGKKALILENVGDARFPNLKTREVHEHADAKTHELGTDAPGRSFSSVGTSRSAMEQTDWHDQEEQRFLHKLAGHLDAAVLAGQAKALILVAPPRALGMLRDSYSSHVRGALRAEIDKDFVKMPVAEIQKHLSA